MPRKPQAQLVEIQLEPTKKKRLTPTVDLPTHITINGYGYPLFAILLDRRIGNNIPKKNIIDRVNMYPENKMTEKQKLLFFELYLDLCHGYYEYYESYKEGIPIGIPHEFTNAWEKLSKLSEQLKTASRAKIPVKIIRETNEYLKNIDQRADCIVEEIEKRKEITVEYYQGFMDHYFTLRTREKSCVVFLETKEWIDIEKQESKEYFILLQKFLIEEGKLLIQEETRKRLEIQEDYFRMFISITQTKERTEIKKYISYGIHVTHFLLFCEMDIYNAIVNLEIFERNAIRKFMNGIKK